MERDMMARYRAGGTIFVSEISVTDITVGNDLAVGGDLNVDGDSTLEAVDVNDKLTSPAQSVVITLSPGDTTLLLEAGDAADVYLVAGGGYLYHTNSGGPTGFIGNFPLSSALAPVLLQGQFYIEDITIYFYTSQAAYSMITRTALRRVNVVTRTATDEPDEIADHGSGTTGNEHYTFTVNKLLDPDYYYMLRIIMQCYFLEHNHIDAFKIRGHFV
jgi:hypothetical protein